MIKKLRIASVKVRASSSTPEISQHATQPSPDSSKQLSANCFAFLSFVSFNNDFLERSLCKSDCNYNKKKCMRENYFLPFSK